LAELKANAATNEAEQPAIIRFADGAAEHVFNVAPFGVAGYEWLLLSGEFAFRIGKWIEPGSRPSVMAEIRSEALWTHGAAACVERVRSILTAMGAIIECVKVSRVDLCVDLLLHESNWSLDLLNHLASRAGHRKPYLDFQRLTGIQIGKGIVVCRLYDKPLEIKQQSHKDWLYDIWGIESVADDHRIIRVEFQFRREALNEFGVDTPDQLLTSVASLWSYASGEWLRVVDDLKKHATRRKDLPWWQVVQLGIPDAATAHPAIRAKAIKSDESQLMLQLIGLVISLCALYRQGDVIESDSVLDLSSHLAFILRRAKECGIDDETFTERVKRKSAMRTRRQEKFKKAESVRKALGATYKKKSRRRPSPG
jgi:hypothetical protein